MSTTFAQTVKCYPPEQAVGNTRTSCGYPHDDRPPPLHGKTVLATAMASDPKLSYAARGVLSWVLSNDNPSISGAGLGRYGWPPIRDQLIDFGYCIPAGGGYWFTDIPHNVVSVSKFVRVTSIAKREISPSLRWEIWERDDFRCQTCGSRRFLTVDHKHPERHGGTLENSNLQTLCRACNSSKGSKLAVGS